MADARTLPQNPTELRSRLEQILIPLLKLLKNVRQFQGSFASDEEIKAQSQTALSAFQSEAKLFYQPGQTPEGESPRLDDLFKLVDHIHTKFKAIENNSAASTYWKYLSQDLYGNAGAFFTLDNLIQPASLTYLYSYLDAISLGANDAIIAEQKKKTEQQIAETKSKVQALGPIAVPPKPKEEKTESESDKIAREASKQQQQSLQDAKEAFFAHELDILNELLPPGHKLSLTDIKRLSEIAGISAFSQLELDSMLAQYGIIEALGLQDSPEAAGLIRDYIFNERQRILIQRKLEGLSTNVFPKEAASMQQGAALISRRFGDKVATNAYFASGKKLNELETAPGGKTDPDLAAGRKLREDSLRAVWDGPKGIRGLVDKATGRDLSRREQLLIDWNVVTREDLAGNTKVPRLFEDFLPMVEDRSVADLLGVPEEVVAIEPVSGQEIPSAPTPAPAVSAPADPAAIKRKLDNLKTMGGVAKTAATNPYLLGGAAIGGGIVYGAITQGVAGALGVGTSALAGAVIGFVAGGPIGALIGGVVGTVLGAGSIAISGSSGFAVSIGNAELSILGSPPATAPLAGSLQAGAQTVLANAGSIVGPGVTQAGQVANSALNGTTAFLQNLSTVPLANTSLAAAAVVGPLIAVGVVTVFVVSPSILSIFLIPTPEHTSIDLQGKVCWPTDGVISALETYPNGSPHGVSAGGSAVDIANPVMGTVVRTPYAGKATTHIDMAGSEYIGYGAYVTVETGNFSLIFGHLNYFWDGSLTPGMTKDFVAGDLVGFMDSRGNSTGSHLHYEVIGKDSSGGKLNIRSILPTVPKAELGARVSSSQCDNPSNMDQNTDRKDCPIPSSFGKTNKPLAGSIQYCFEGPGRLGLAAKAYISQLDHGFCNYYNQPLDPQFRPPARNPLWNESLYQSGQGFYDFSVTNQKISYYDLAWCTSLVINVYAANYHGPNSSMFSPNSGFAGVFNMRNGWEKATGQPIKLVSEISSLDDVPIGTTLFYGVDHVGMVCDKNGTTITSCEANTDTTEKVYTLDELKNKVTHLGLPPEGIDEQTCYDAPTVENPTHSPLP